VFAGKPYAGLSGVSRSFAEAEKLYLQTGKKETSARSELRNLSAMINQMEDLISRAGDAQALSAFERFLNQTASDPLEQNHLLVAVARLMIRQLEDSDNPDASQLINTWKKLVFADVDSDDTTVKEALRLMQKSMEMLSADRSSARNGPVLAEQIRIFIEEHLSDQMLSQNMIAEHFQISQSHLSHLFKREFQIGMNDYINHARVVRSLPYLLDPKLSISDVAEKIGFNSSHTLIRVFKKYENMTPGRYRMINDVTADDSGE
jgi:AraC-like DNA-binding protein